MFKALKKIPKFVKEAKEELKKINWASRKELVSATVLVIIVAALVTSYIAVIDLGLSRAIQLLLR
ncbi:MAG: preprotein translocase subunit SecE [Candidatus Omnitrophica bacterium]|nr:preprotein translocase subunit SecE [Candidatus Omnitrophota bacterium]MBD3269851.1 preprotein translocase subunit SecE [Candidatus Omnitrophota bacterium]